MNGPEAYGLYMALRLHFSVKSYDAKKFNFKTKHRYEGRADNYLFVKLAKHRDPQGLMIANFSHDPGMWFGQLFSAEAQKRYTNWAGYREAMPYFFSQELNKLDRDDFRADSQHPPALRKFFRKEITLDTLTICNDFIRFSEVWKRGLGNDPTWKEVHHLIQKNKTFLDYDKEKFKTILAKWLENCLTS